MVKCMEVTACVLAIATSAKPQGPTSHELVQALQAFSPGDYSGSPWVRKVSCKLLDDPTEFFCSYEQRQREGWARFTVYLALDGKHWVVIDAPQSASSQHSGSAKP